MKRLSLLLSALLAVALLAGCGSKAPETTAPTATEPVQKAAD